MNLIEILKQAKRREASILMEFENVDFKVTTYFMDETVPAIGVYFLDVSGKMFFGEIELPGDGVSMIYTDSTKEGEISYIEIVDPSDFLSDPALDNIGINGYNVKELIRVAYRRLNIEQLI